MNAHVRIKCVNLTLNCQTCVSGMYNCSPVLSSSRSLYGFSAPSLSTTLPLVFDTLVAEVIVFKSLDSNDKGSTSAGFKSTSLALVVGERADVSSSDNSLILFSKLVSVGGVSGASKNSSSSLLSLFLSSLSGET